MITEQTIWQTIWPVVEQAIEATLAENTNALRPLLVPGEQAAETLDLFGHTVFDILFKTVLGRESLGLTKAVETENGRYVYLEYAWPDPTSPDQSYTAADIVTVQLATRENAWQIMAINPADIDLPLTSARARGILAANKVLTDAHQSASEPWILPVAFYGGLLQIPLLPTAMRDPVEKLLLPGLQHRTYGLMSLIYGRRLWRDFVATTTPSLTRPAAWAAAAEYLISQQDMRQMTQAAVGKHYKIGLTTFLPRIKQIKKALNIQGLDERYTDLQTTQMIYTDQNNPES